MKQFAASFSPRPFKPPPLIRTRFRDSFDQGSELPSCPEITLVCDSVDVSGQKCGFLAFGAADDLTGTPYSHATGPCQPVGVYNESLTFDTEAADYIFKTLTFVFSGCNDPDGTGCDHTTGSTTIVWTSSVSGGCIVTLPELSGSLGSECSASGSFTDGSTTFPSSGSCFPPGNWCQELDATLSVPYTTELLVSEVESELETTDYPDTWTGACSAVRDLSEDETSFTLQKFRYKFSFPAAAADFLLEWMEGGTPKSELISMGDTESSVYEVLPPEANGTITITDDVCTMPPP